MLARPPSAPEAREELRLDPGLGPAIATELAEFFAEPRNRAALDDLAREVTPEDSAAVGAVDSPFAGKAVVFTGTLSTMSRDEAEGRRERWAPR
jgi:DNA ligase (NAD+)